MSKLETLIQNGFNITQIESNKYIVVDNGRFGFITNEDPFVIDEDDLDEIYESYIENN